MKRRLSGRRSIRVVCHSGLEIAPLRPPEALADAEPNEADPKLASGSVWQLLAVMHADGASTIHSAELSSRLEACTVLRKPCPRVASYRATVTALPLTLTDACIRSPGLTVSRIAADGAGTSSYQAVELTLP